MHLVRTIKESNERIEKLTHLTKELEASIQLLYQTSIIALHKALIIKQIAKAFGMWEQTDRKDGCTTMYTTIITRATGDL